MIMCIDDVLLVANEERDIGCDRKPHENMAARDGEPSAVRYSKGFWKLIDLLKSTVVLLPIMAPCNLDDKMDEMT